MKILGLDIATKTGWAIYDTKADMSAIETGTFESAGDTPEDKAAAMAGHLIPMLKAFKPDFVAIEQPMRSVMSFKKVKRDLAGEQDQQTINPNALQLQGLVCAAVAVSSGMRIPWGTISPATWRKGFFGFSRNPAFDRPRWKKEAVNRCQTLKIRVKGSDAAEAVGIAFAGASHQKAKMILMEREVA